LFTFETLLALLFGYLLGSIPFGLLITKAAGTQDIRTIGSQNIGATNVLRTGRKDLAAATLLCDALKGTVAILIAARWGEGPAMAAALGAFAGHVFPVWLKFKGGKGVATYLGCLLGLYWPAGVLFALVWLAVAKVTRYSSLAAFVASALAPFAFFATGQGPQGLLAVVLAAMIFFTHRANIARLRAGSESRIGQQT
jgi:glycerol-3-phosphate acyltransferase PlsY